MVQWSELSGQTLKAICQRRSLAKLFRNRAVSALIGFADCVHLGGIDAAGFTPPEVFAAAIAEGLLTDGRYGSRRAGNGCFHSVADGPWLGDLLKQP